MQVTGIKVNELLSPEQAGKVVEEVVKEHYRLRAETQGAALGGEAWEPHSAFSTEALGYDWQVLHRGKTQMLRRIRGKQAKVTIEGSRVRVDFLSDVTVQKGGNHNLGSIHQFGVRGPIRAKGNYPLMVPKVRKGGKPGGRWAAFDSERVDGKRMYKTAGRKGRPSRTIEIEEEAFVKVFKPGTKRGVPGEILPTSHKAGSYVIPPRPLYQWTEEDVRVLKERLADAVQRNVGG